MCLSGKKLPDIEFRGVLQIYFLVMTLLSCRIEGQGRDGRRRILHYSYCLIGARVQASTYLFVEFFHWYREVHTLYGLVLSDTAALNRKAVSILFKVESFSQPSRWCLVLVVCAVLQQLISQRFLRDIVPAKRFEATCLP